MASLPSPPSSNSGHGPFVPNHSCSCCNLSQLQYVVPLAPLINNVVLLPCKALALNNVGEKEAMQDCCRKPLMEYLTLCCLAGRAHDSGIGSIIEAPWMARLDVMGSFPAYIMFRRLPSGILLDEPGCLARHEWWTSGLSRILTS